MEEIGDRRAHRLSFVRSLVRPAVRRPARRIVRYSSAMRLLAASRAERPAGHIYVYILIFNRACGQLQVVVLLRPAAQLERDPPAPPAHLAVLFIRAAPGAGAGSAWMRGAALNLAHELAATSPFRAGWLAGWRAENIGRRRRSQRRQCGDTPRPREDILDDDISGCSANKRPFKTNCHNALGRLCQLSARLGSARLH